MAVAFMLWIVIIVSARIEKENAQKTRSQKLRVFHRHIRILILQRLSSLQYLLPLSYRSYRIFP